MNHERVDNPKFVTEADYFLRFPPYQPKYEVGSYVESCGIPVPKRFDNLQAAVTSGKPFIIRSEHPQDYAGASGIVDSLEVTPHFIEMAKEAIAKNSYQIYTVDEQKAEKARDNILAHIDTISDAELKALMLQMSAFSIGEYCRLKQIDRNAFEHEVTFSFWEYINGTSHIVVADSAVDGRIHIFSHREYPDFYYNYVIVEHGDHIFKGFKYKDDVKRLNLYKISKFYETVRALPNFDPTNVPIIEMVEDDNQLYFLQYLHGRKYQPAGFTLDREPEAGEVVSQWVRGVTPETGIVCDTRFWYRNSALKDLILKDEEASFDFHWNFVFSELMTPRRKVQFVLSNSLYDLAMKSIDNHLQKSKLFRPDVSVSLNNENFVKMAPEFDYDLGNDKTTDVRKSLGVADFQDVHLKLRIISDGRKAYIKKA